jgi:hypothetical protein
MATETELTLNALISVWGLLPDLAGSSWSEAQRELTLYLDQLQGARTLDEQAPIVYRIRKYLRTKLPAAYARLAEEIERLRTESVRGGLESAAQLAVEPCSDAVRRSRELVHAGEPRYLQGTVSAGEKEVEVLRAGGAYQLKAWIGVEQTGVRHVPDPIDLSALPPAQERYLLDVLFLAPGSGAQKGQIVLRPENPESSACLFAFVVPAGLREFKAYMVVSYQAKIMLQAAELCGHVIEGNADSGEADKWTFASVALKDLGTVLKDEGRSSYDWIGFACEQGLILPAIGDFVNPDGYDEDRTTIMDVLKEASGPSPSAVAALSGLAWQGGKLFETLCSQDPGLSLLANDRPEARLRLQFVEPPNTPFPIELLYVYPPPYEPNPKICSGYRPGLDHSGCPECRGRTASDFAGIICPAGFLGIRAIIERRVLPNGKPNAGYEVKLDLEPKNKVLTPLDRVLWAASEKITGGAAFEAVVNETSARAGCAADWQRFDELIAELKPTLILLMPHIPQAAGGMQLLEISDVLQPAAKKPSMRAGEALRDHTRVPDGPHPLVLLLGCSSAQLRTPFLSPVTAARKGGAAVTIATLAPIHESQATYIAGVVLRSLRQIADRASGQGCTVGEFMTLVRSAAMEQGYYGALGLITDGDADWYIPSAGGGGNV